MLLAFAFWAFIGEEVTPGALLAAALALPAAFALTLDFAFTLGFGLCLGCCSIEESKSVHGAASSGEACSTDSGAGSGGGKKQA